MFDQLRLAGEYAHLSLATYLKLLESDRIAQSARLYDLEVDKIAVRIVALGKTEAFKAAVAAGDAGAVMELLGKVLYTKERRADGGSGETPQG